MPALLTIPVALPPALGTLIDRLDRAVTQPTQQIPHAAAKALMSVSRADDVLTDAQQVGSSERYTRHILHSHHKGRYTLVALVWQPGQRTPAHGHYTWCAYRMLEGALQEERFSWDDERRIARLGDVVNLNASHCFSAHAGLEKIHRLSNTSQNRAISLHVYGVNGDHVSTHVNHVVSERQDA